MKKIQEFRLLMQGILLIYIALGFYSAFSQPTKPTCKPYMWIKRDISGQQRNNFKNGKLKSMSVKAHLPPGTFLNDSCRLDNFWQMIKYFGNNCRCKPDF